jgi:hypothetical protein
MAYYPWGLGIPPIVPGSFVWFSRLRISQAAPDSASPYRFAIERTSDRRRPSRRVSRLAALCIDCEPAILQADHRGCHPVQFEQLKRREFITVLGGAA